MTIMIIVKMIYKHEDFLKMIHLLLISELLNSNGTDSLNKQSKNEITLFLCVNVLVLSHTILP